MCGVILVDTLRPTGRLRPIARGWIITVHAQTTTRIRAGLAQGAARILARKLRVLSAVTGAPLDMGRWARSGSDGARQNARRHDLCLLSVHRSTSHGYGFIFHCNRQLSEQMRHQDQLNLRRENYASCLFNMQLRLSTASL